MAARGFRVCGMSVRKREFLRHNSCMAIERERRDAEVVYERSRPSGVAMLALLVAIAALIISILAYNRTGTRIDDRIEAKFEEYSNEANIENARSDAARRLEDVKIRIESGTYTGVATSVGTIRENTRKALNRFGTSTEWEDLNVRFERLADEVKNRSSRALQTIDELINDLGDRYQNNNR
jgi:hypothetical protein